MNSEAKAVSLLSRRERDVFAHIIRGWPSVAIAMRLGITMKTIDTHRMRINKKLGTHNNLGVLRVALVSGFMTMDQLEHEYDQTIRNDQKAPTFLPPLSGPVGRRRSRNRSVHEERKVN